MSDDVNIKTEKVGGGFWTNEATRARATDSAGKTVAETYSPGHDDDAASTARANLESKLATQRQLPEEDKE